MLIDDFYFWIDWLKGTPEQKKRAVQKRRYDAIVQAAVKRVKDKMSRSSPPISNLNFFGATELDPKYLSIWYFFPTIADVKQSESSGHMQAIRDLTLTELAARQYPQQALPEISISFASDEEVEKDWDGNYFEFLK